MEEILNIQNNIDEIKDNINDGTYLNICNSIKHVYEEFKKNTVKKTFDRNRLDRLTYLWKIGKIGDLNENKEESEKYHDENNELKKIRENVDEEDYYHTRFILACKHNMIDSVKMLISFGANVNSIDNKKRTGFIVACINNNEDIVRILLEHKQCDLNIKDVILRTGFMHACHKGHNNLVNLLVDKVDIHINDCLGNNAIELAMMYEKYETVERLINFYDINSLSEHILILCSYNKYLDIAKLLLDKGYKKNINESLINSVVCNNIDMIKLLLKYGADVNFVDVHDDNNTSLLKASTYGYLDIIKYLIKEGADTRHENINHETAYSMVIQTNNYDTIKYFNENDITYISQENKWYNDIIVPITNKTNKNKYIIYYISCIFLCIIIIFKILNLL